MPRINPIFGPNKLKLGIFGTNGRSPTMTMVPELYKVSWPMAIETARLADEAGFEAIVPYARWKGYIPGEPNDPTGTVLEPFTFAAAIAQATSHAAVFATSHAPTVHPVMAAKMAATVDIISGGRFVLNVVGGWNKPELEMFGAPLREHDQRYDYLAEWLEIMERLWSDPKEFDFEGEFFTLKRGSSMPKPLQQPRIPIMNAGGSDRGRGFACQHADMCFNIIKSEDSSQIRAEVESYRAEARERFGRDIGIWTIGSVIQRDTAEEANAYLHHVTVEQQDVRVADAWMELQLEHAQLMPPEKMAAFRRRFVEGAGGFPLVGTVDDIYERLAMLAECGIDGVLLTWVDYIDGLHRFNSSVLPQLEAAGLRAPFRAQQA